ncbi:MAG: flavodoxin family protein, partial [Candidatus Thiodiazotropha taylori]|nr:flavodoxin family protein [Candidatus Thiodiazotropha taylori]MCW4291200.1 flavodoxin family protein [Candidatus Thiodiazotropha taylori]
SLCGMRYLPPFALFGARTAVDEGRIGQHIDTWIELHKALRDQKLDIETAQKLAGLNSDLNHLIKET